MRFFGLSMSLGPFLEEAADRIVCCQGIKNTGTKLCCMRNIRVKNVLRLATSMVLVSLFLVSLSLLAQATPTKRVKAENFPLEVSVPSDWEALPPSPKNDPNVLLFFDSPDGSPVESIVSFEVYPLSGKWDDIIKKETQKLPVWEGAPLVTNEAFTLREAQGHRWVYRTRDKDGLTRVYYRLYVLLPESFGPKRLLEMQGTAQTKEDLQVVPFFDEMIGTITWGVQAQGTWFF